MEYETHIRNAEENVRAAIHAYKMKWNTVVAETAFKTVEQAIEMHAALEGIHMRSHAERIGFADERYPEVAKVLRRLRRNYGDLGYDGINGEKATESIGLMKRALRTIGEVINFDFEEWFD